ncbi:uncharacterized protein CXorf58 homolog isoform X2 [Acropora palmata]|uniref:uncharacterized protein CXorf58 homolog isoform X2 n=1 Tax=Acropora palmata TaxID=6131 RepID=UPI003DA047E2
MGQSNCEISSDTRLVRVEAARKIERCWCCYRDKQMFKLLKYAICAAEHSLTYEVLRKVSPLEADLLRDPVVQARVRFRFGGTEFPPIIMFKIFVQSGGQGVKYYCGKKVIKPSSKAACDSLTLMGNRKFYDQLIADLCQHEKDKITDETDVTTLKDYMQYLSHLDECPADIGGKSNTWRRLTLDAIPRQNIMRDIFGKNTLAEYSNTSPSRRSRQAMTRVAKMRKSYGMDPPKLEGKTPATAVINNGLFDDEEDWEDQADKLYQWTQTLSLDELGVTSS